MIYAYEQYKMMLMSYRRSHVSWARETG